MKLTALAIGLALICGCADNPSPERRAEAPHPTEAPPRVSGGFDIYTPTLEPFPKLDPFSTNRLRFKTGDKSEFKHAWNAEDYEAGYRRGLQDFMMMLLESRLYQTNRSAGHMALILCERWNIPADPIWTNALPVDFAK